MPGAARGTRTAAVDDKARLHDALVANLGVDGTSDHNYQNDEIVMALTEAGVDSFNTQFVTLTVDDINSLVHDDGNGNKVPLHLMKR